MGKAIILALSAILLFLAGSFWLALYPTVPIDLGGAESLELGARRVVIPVGEDDRVFAWAQPGTKRALVVLLPGYARDHRRMSRYAQFLQRAGYATLAVQFRSARAKDRKPTTLGYWELRDARAVLAWVASQPRYGGYRVALYGESLGGAVALVVAAEHPEVAAVVADCPFANGRMAIEDGLSAVYQLPRWPTTDLAILMGRLLTGHDLTALDPTLALTQLGERPVLLIQGGMEDRFSLRQVRRLENAAGPGVESWVLRDAGHNAGWSRHRREYELRVRGFLARVFRDVGAAPHENGDAK
ncbi:MAG: alpha/beta fold hydrolase [Candidatus Eisenbacteria bacterium]